MWRDTGINVVELIRRCCGRLGNSVYQVLTSQEDKVFRSDHKRLVSSRRTSQMAGERDIGGLVLDLTIGLSMRTEPQTRNCALCTHLLTSLMNAGRLWLLALDIHRTL